MEKHRLNMQIGNLMQHVTFPDRDSAIAALAKLFSAKIEGTTAIGMLDAPVVVDPNAVSFAEVRKI